MIDHCWRAFLIGLNGQAKPIPSVQRWISKNAINHIEREFEPIRLFCINRKIEIVRFRLLCQGNQGGH